MGCEEGDPAAASLRGCGGASSASATCSRVKFFNSESNAAGDGFLVSGMSGFLASTVSGFFVSRFFSNFSKAAGSLFFGSGRGT